MSAQDRDTRVGCHSQDGQIAGLSLWGGHGSPRVDTSERSELFSPSLL